MKARFCALLTSSILVSAAGAKSQPVMDGAGQPRWAQSSVHEAARLRKAPATASHRGTNTTAASATGEATPNDVPQASSVRNAQGVSSTFQPSGDLTNPSTEAFFQALGTNERTCQTCHQPDAGWTITPKNIKRLFRSDSSAPLFRTVDGAVCGSADTSTPSAAAAAYALLINKGLIRVFLPMPDTGKLQFSITQVDDPYHCTNDPAQGLTSPATGIVSVYRRPLPSTNLPFEHELMWDGREPSLESQAVDAVAIHMQGTARPSAEQAARAAQFESGLYSAQARDKSAGDLVDENAQGGATALSATSPQAVSDVLTGGSATPAAMTLFAAWSGDPDERKASIARGENVFNEKTFAITNVRGLNDQPGFTTVTGTCATCHNAPNVGNHGSKLPLDIGVTTAPAAIPGGGDNLSSPDYPVFTLHCDSGPLAGTTRLVTDPGVAMITGQCADIGKLKVPTLRNLAARPPYFHNGSAPDLANMVEFYQHRFNIGFSDQETTDLIAFLSAL